MSYVQYGPFDDGGAPGISSSFLNPLETFLLSLNSAAHDPNISSNGSGNMTATSYATANGTVHGTSFLATPYAVASNISMTNGATNTYTCTGGLTGVPTGAVGVLIAYAYNSGATNTCITFTPHGAVWSNGNYPASMPEATASAIGAFGSATVPLDSNGKMDVKCANANITALYVQIYGYII